MPGDDHAGSQSLNGQQASLQKLGQIWTVAEAKIRHDVELLRDRADETVRRRPGRPRQMDAEFQVHVDKVFATFDGTLVKQLTAAAAPAPNRS